MWTISVFGLLRQYTVSYCHTVAAKISRLTEAFSFQHSSLEVSCWSHQFIHYVYLWMSTFILGDNFCFNRFILQSWWQLGSVKIISANLFLKHIYTVYSQRASPTTLPNSTSQRNNALLLQRSMEQSGNCDENNNSEASSVSYLAVGMLSEKASGRTGWVNSKQIPPRCQGNVLFRHQELQLSFGQRWLAVGGRGRANWGVSSVRLATWACCVHVSLRNIVSAAIARKN